MAKGNGNSRRPAKRTQNPSPTTLRGLAEHLQLSPATISLVLNRAPAAKAIPKDTQERIRRAAEKMNYRPNFFARSLRKRRSFTVGVILPELSEGYAALLMSGLEARLLEEGYFYFVVGHHGKPDLIEEYPKLLMDRAVEGFIFINTPLTHSSGLPAVAIGGHENLRGVSNVVLDNRRAAWLALEHLAKLGHRQIAFFKGHPGSMDTEERWEGLEEAASALGIKISRDLTVQLKSLLPTPDPSAPEEGYVYAQRLLARKVPFTALVAFNDISAIGAMRAIRDAGLRVPQDISVFGFDDITAAAFHFPRLTTVRQPLRYMGEMAAVTLLRRITAQDDSPEKILVEPELVIRESTFAPGSSGSDKDV